jgi:hypothetical protein
MIWNDLIEECTQKGDAMLGKGFPERAKQAIEIDDR